jgi:hypothetical protein
MGDLSEARRAKAEQARLRADRLADAYAATGSVSKAARAIGVSRQHASRVLNSRETLTRLREAYQLAGLSVEFWAATLREMATATKTINVPIAPGVFEQRDVPDWRARGEAFRLHQATHEKLMALEAGEATDPDAEVIEIVSPAEKVGKTRAELFALYHERLARMPATPPRRRR